MEYEPHTFVLEHDAEGRVVEAFSPDFFLPEQDLYLEMTTMKQSLVTRKNRKLRKLREQYPDVKVKLFYKRDIERLAQRYGLESRRSLTATVSDRAPATQLRRDRRGLPLGATRDRGPGRRARRGDRRRLRRPRAAARRRR